MGQASSVAEKVQHEENRADGHHGMKHGIPYRWTPSTPPPPSRCLEAGPVQLRREEARALHCATGLARAAAAGALSSAATLSTTAATAVTCLAGGYINRASTNVGLSHNWSKNNTMGSYPRDRGRERAHAVTLSSQ